MINFQEINSDIVGIGIDVVKIERIKAIYSKFGQKFLDKNYHPMELELFNKQVTTKKPTFLAKRFAGKEAVAKALGKGIGELHFSDIAIINDHYGKPEVKIFSHILAEKYKIFISLADEPPIATAFVVIVHPTPVALKPRLSLFHQASTEHENKYYQPDINV